MGLDVRQLTLWEFNATVAGYAKATGGKVDEGLSDDEFDRLGSLLDQYNGHR